MTAKELIQKLQEVAPETQIVIRGYEDLPVRKLTQTGGFNDIQKLIERKIISHPDQKADYYGEYAEADLSACNAQAEKGTKAIELWGENTKSEN